MPESPTVTVYTDTTREPWVFADCRWKVDPVGCLHVFRATMERTDGPPKRVSTTATFEEAGGRGTEKRTMVAAFGVGSWALVHSDAEVWA